MATLLQTMDIMCAKPSYTRAVRMTTDKLRSVVEKFEEGKISKKTFLSRSQKVLNNGYEKAYRSGSGVSSKSEAGQTWIENFAAEQFGFLSKFADEIESGTGTMDNLERADMYGRAVQSAYWAGASLESEEGEVFNWILNPAIENCEDCIQNSDGGPYSHDNLPGFPGDGQTKCLGRCGCSIVKA